MSSHITPEIIAQRREALARIKQFTRVQTVEEAVPDLFSAPVIELKYNYVCVVANRKFVDDDLYLILVVDDVEKTLTTLNRAHPLVSQLRVYHMWKVDARQQIDMRKPMHRYRNTGDWYHVNITEALRVMQPVIASTSGSRVSCAPPAASDPETEMFRAAIQSYFGFADYTLSELRTAEAEIDVKLLIPHITQAARTNIGRWNEDVYRRALGILRYAELSTPVQVRWIGEPPEQPIECSEINK